MFRTVFLHILGVSLLFLGTGCVRGVRYETDKSDASYYRGVRAAPSSASIATPNELGWADLVSGVILSGISLAANPSYYDTFGIHGKLVCRQKDNFILSCPGLWVILLDQNGREVSRQHTVVGTFHFATEPGRDYSLRVRSAQFVLNNQPVSIREGEDVVLQLVSPRRNF